MSSTTSSATGELMSNVEERVVYIVMSAFAQISRETDGPSRLLIRQSTDEGEQESINRVANFIRGLEVEGLDEVDPANTMLMKIQEIPLLPLETVATPTPNRMYAAFPSMLAYENFMSLRSLAISGSNWNDIVGTPPLLASPAAYTPFLYRVDPQFAGNYGTGTAPAPSHGFTPFRVNPQLTGNYGTGTAPAPSHGFTPFSSHYYNGQDTNGNTYYGYQYNGPM